jgi:hypothetical protein
MHVSAWSGRGESPPISGLSPLPGPVYRTDARGWRFPVRTDGLTPVVTHGSTILQIVCHGVVSSHSRRCDCFLVAEPA